MVGTVATRLRWGMLLLATAAAGGCGRQAAKDRGMAIERAIQRCDMSSGQSSLIPVEVVAVEPQGAEWRVDLVGLWADRQPFELVLTSTVPGATAQPTSLPDYIGRCHVLVKEHGGRVESDDGFNVLTRPWVGPTLTAGVATSYAFSAKWRAEATASLRATRTAEAGRRPEQRSQ